jgi:hypothetical protein
MMPKGSIHGFINGVIILNVFGEFNPKLMCMLVVSSTSTLNEGNDLVSLLEDPTHPPVKCWVIGNIHGKCKLSNLERVNSFRLDNFCQEVLPSFQSQQSSHPYGESV